ncbi:AI-2E family transporter [Pseudonocardia kujensis]|uniref:AI-2E family transporter n=1 Tax=Pseudonocardia kujensis TaxID=1128675 RepID=UPI001E4535E8|nr:AI-2E family transporter [Pseudonocardia kujensis]MCE0768230.1 AI-2E family transporter [Pseudonocardia kujensis]
MTRTSRSPFRIGMVGAAGVGLTAGLAALVFTARNMLVLIGLALFFAVGLEPAVASLVRRGLARWAAVAAVCAGIAALVGGLIAAAIPPLIAQVAAFRAAVPLYVRMLNDRSSFLGGLNERFHLQQSVEQALAGGGSGLVSGVFGAGAVVVDAVVSTGVVVVLTVYFLGSLPKIRSAFHQLIPRSRRARVAQLGDEIATRVSGYVLGNLLTSLVATVLTYIWLLIFHVPYALLLAALVGFLDLIPTIGSTLAGVVVCLGAWTVSWPVAVATAGYFVVYRLFEDYVLSPKVFSRAVRMSPVATLVAVLLGGALLGIVGALVAIPVAAGIQLVVREVVLPRLDEA